MTTINGVSVTNAMMTGTALEAGAGFDGETLLLYCQTQLNDLNVDLKGKMAAQREAREQKQLLNKLTSFLGKYAQTGVGVADDGARWDIMKTYADLITKMPAGPNRDALITQFNQFRSSTCYQNGPVPPVPLNTPEELWRYVSAPEGQLGLSEELKLGRASDGKPVMERSNDMTGEEIAGQLKALQPVGEEIGQNAELGMIELQQVVSQRQMAIQMATNMMNKFLQGLESIAANVGK